MFVIALTLCKHSGIKVPHIKESEGIYLEKKSSNSVPKNSN